MELNNFNKKFKEFIDKHELLDLGAKYNFNNEVKVYLGSGMMFSQLGQIGLEILADCCEAVNINYYLPQHNAGINKKDAGRTITNAMIADGDNAELEQCQFMLSYKTYPEDAGLMGESSKFIEMCKYEPDKYWGLVTILDDIRTLGVPNPSQIGKDNQHLYTNSYCDGVAEKTIGFVDTIEDAFKKMYKVYLGKKRANEILDLIDKIRK